MEHAYLGAAPRTHRNLPGRRGCFWEEPPVASEPPMTSTDQLRLLTVHAHPDDESSKGAGTVARYHDAGAHCVLVCCTGGEAGSILNPAMDTPEVHADLPAVR